MLPHIYFEVEDKETHLLLHGANLNGTKTPLFWDTGSDISFYEPKQLAETQKVPTQFQNQEFLFHLNPKKGILPEGIIGLLGVDFFEQTCVYWEIENLYIFPSDSSFCKKPDVYLSTNLKILNTKKKGDHFYAQFQFAGKENHWALLDTGSSLSILPTEEGARFIGERKVFLPGNRILAANLFESQGKLSLIERSGVLQDYSQVLFLGGISLENLDFPGDKEKEEVWVIGLDVLRKKPLFWDFSRNQIGILTHQN